MVMKSFLGEYLSMPGDSIVLYFESNLSFPFNASNLASTGTGLVFRYYKVLNRSG